MTSKLPNRPKPAETSYIFHIERAHRRNFLEWRCKEEAFKHYVEIERRGFSKR